MKKKRGKFSVINGGRFGLKVYVGGIGQTPLNTIVAKSTNEAYALLLDHQYGCDPAGAFAEPEVDMNIIRRFKNRCMGVYQRPPVEE